MARSHYTYEKRQIELKKKKKREEKLLKKKEGVTEPTDDAAEYLAMLRGESFNSNEDDQDNTELPKGTEPESK